MDDSMVQSKVIVDVMMERKRQDEKWGEQNHNPYIYLTILIEEVGELGQAILETQFGGKHGGWENVRKEAIHCTAVALALVECLDRDKWEDDDVGFDHFLRERDKVSVEHILKQRDLNG